MIAYPLLAGPTQTISVQNHNGEVEEAKSKHPSKANKKVADYELHVGNFVTKYETVDLLSITLSVAIHD